MIIVDLHVSPVRLFFFFFCLVAVTAKHQPANPGVKPVCFSFKSEMCIANLTDDLSLVGRASYLAPLGSKSIARPSCYAGTTGAEGFRTEVARRMWEMKVQVTSVLVHCECGEKECDFLTALAQIEFALSTCLKHNPILWSLCGMCGPVITVFFCVKSPGLVAFSVEFFKGGNMNKTYFSSIMWPFFSCDGKTLIRFLHSLKKIFSCDLFRARNKKL